MAKLLISAALTVGMLTPSAAFAADKTVTLVVKNMYCADCPFVVRKSLEAVPGVAQVTVS